MTAESRNLALDWVPIQQGRLALSHRPKKKAIQQFPDLGVTHVLTLLSAKEGGESMGSEVKRAGLSWLWLPMNSAEPPADDRKVEILNCFREAQDCLTQGGSLLIHCSAGIHRTGMIAYALLRFLGQSSEQAGRKLKELRSHTFEGVGAHRIAWGEQYSASQDTTEKGA